MRPQSPESASVNAVATVGSVLTDLVEIVERLPVKPADAEPTAKMLDRLSEEMKEAAELIRLAAQ